MLLHRTKTLPRYACRLVCRQARWPHLLSSLLLAAFAAGCLEMAWLARTAERGGPEQLAFGVGLTGALLGGVGAALSIGHLVAALRDTNWLLRYGPEGLLVRFRSYLDGHVPEHRPTVAFLAASEIERVVLRTRRPSPGEAPDGAPRAVFLDLHLARGDAAGLAEAIARDLDAAPPGRVGLRFRARHVPVSIPERGVIRLAWRGPGTRVVPDADRVLHALGATLRVEVEQPTESAWRAARDEGLEGRLRDMCEQGDTLGALAVARAHYDLSQRDARALLDRLAGSH